MDVDANADFYSLADEKFDFDISLSPASSKGDSDEDDEVFVGPISHKEKCISAGLEQQTDGCVDGGLSGAEAPSWIPPSGNNFDAISKEAHHLADQLEARQQKEPDAEKADCSMAMGKHTENFVEDTSAKFGLFSHPGNAVLSPIKRETFCVKDSPMKQLPPAIQQHLLRGNSSSKGVVAALPRARLSTSSPVSATKTQPRMTLRARAGLGTNGLLPSKPAAPTTSTSTHVAAKTRAAAPAKPTRLAPPSKAGMGLRRRPAPRSSSRAGSCEDLSDAASVASDVSDSSLNGSIQGGKTVPPPRKSILKSLSAVKALPQGKVAVEKNRNTSSSSSSVSSFNSSLSISPTGKGKLNTSQNSSVVRPGSRALAATSRLMNPSTGTAKTHSSAANKKAPAPAASAAAVSRRSISTQPRKSTEADRSKPSRSTPQKRSEPSTPLHQTPAKRVMERSSVSGVSSLAAVKPLLGARAKALVAPVPTGQLMVRAGTDALTSPDAAHIMKPKRLISTSSVDSLPRRSALQVPQTPSTPSAGSNKARMSVSALPTPVSRRTSGIPTMTPRRMSRTSMASPAVTFLPTSVRRPSIPSPHPTAEEEEGQQRCHQDIPPFSLGMEEAASGASAPPVLPETDTQETEPSPSPTPTDGQEDPEPPHSSEEQPSVSQENQEPEPKVDLINLHPAEDDRNTKPEIIEVLLVDLPTPVLRPQEKLLIDLSNTPELMRTSITKPCAGGQLIDLSSPLIKWSPEDKKENVANEAPLINLSF